MASSLRDEDAVSRLANSRGSNEAPFLGPHHLAAANRVEQLIRRAQLAPRVTMSYSSVSVDSGSAVNGAEHASEAAADARLKLSRLASTLPADCWGVIFDVCGMGKGLQLVETERRWPRRSAKLVLRIALDQLAVQFGLSARAAGSEKARTRGWLENRLPLIADKEP